VVDEGGGVVVAEGDGELQISGPNVMRGYWNLPERDASAFVPDADGTRWYRTGDVVRRLADGHFRYLGRRDRMVKRRGYRVELGEIEAEALEERILRRLLEQQLGRQARGEAPGEAGLAGADRAFHHQVAEFIHGTRSTPPP
jgi:acyl-CoA synthetase (AMP-forming)/AMP-acid ligase II